MCGIFAYSGSSRDASQAVLEGLKRLDYRGYDSWGVAALHEGFVLTKHVGEVDPKKARLPSSLIAIGHTRWATHGKVTVANAHPHTASDDSFVLAHNGIVENFADLKRSLQEDYTFVTETDTEAIVRLIERERVKAKGLVSAVRAAFKKLAGRNTIIILTREGDIIAARNGSPLVLGRAKNGELYLSSDVLSFAAHVREVSVIENGVMVHITGASVACIDIARGTRSTPRFEKNAIVGQEVSKGTYPYFMIKEIHEAPAVIRTAAHTDAKALERLAREVRSARHVYCIGSGTAGAAAAQIAFYLRTIGGVPATSLIGAEASDYYSLFKKGDLMIAPSQSGETADVLEVLEFAKKRGVKIASHVNMPGSYMTRISDFPFMAEAGPEICVMSTKIFVSQIAWGFLLAHAVAKRADAGRRALLAISRAASAYLADKEAMHAVEALAKQYAPEEHLFLLTKGEQLQIMKEAMVKIIEGAYVHAHGIPAGDLKHYAITLMQPGTPVLALTTEGALQKDIENAVHEVRARGAAVATIGPSSIAGLPGLTMPRVASGASILSIIPLQLLAYHMAVARGNNVDKPRNIAKSVTVK